jgi:HK97 family phage portal protein
VKNPFKFLTSFRGGQAAPAPVEPTLAPSQDISPQNGAVLIKSSDPQVIAVLGGSAAASSGFAVTSESAMRVSAVYAAIRLLGGAIGSIPVSIFRDTPQGRESISPDLWWLLNEQPINNWTAASMWNWVLQSICLRGDGFVEIVRAGASVKALRPFHPDAVSVLRIDDTLVYTVCDQNGKMRTLHQDDMLHFPGFGFNGTRSMSVIAWAAFQSIGIALATDALSGSFYANGAAPKHVIKATGEMDPEQVEQLRNEYKAKYAGVSNGGTPMVLTEGLDIKEMSMSAGDAQLLESRKFQVIDIARAFGVPPHMIGAQETTSSWGTGIEQMSIGFIRWALQPHINQIRQELNRKLFRRASPFVEHQMNALLAGDSKAEAERTRQEVGGSQGPGWKTINEVRKDMNLPPIEGGNVLYRPDKPAAPTKPKEDDETTGATDPK